MSVQRRSRGFWDELPPKTLAPAAPAAEAALDVQPVPVARGAKVPQKQRPQSCIGYQHGSGLFDYIRLKGLLLSSLKTYEQHYISDLFKDYIIIHFLKITMFSQMGVFFWCKEAAATAATAARAPLGRLRGGSRSKVYDFLERNLVQRFPASVLTETNFQTFRLLFANMFSQIAAKRINANHPHRTD